MARKSSVISVLITGDAGPLQKAVGKAGSTLANFGKKAALALVAAGAATAALAGKLIAAGEAASTANARIDQIVKQMDLFGDSAGQVSERLIKTGEALARLTGVETNTIKETQGVLLTFANLAKTADQVGGQFDRATKAAVDLAAAGFGTAQSNAVQLGKALQDPVKGLTALARSGVTFTEEEKNRIKALVQSNQVSEAQLLILEAIEKQVGGTAEATANATDKMRVAFDQAKQRLGLALLPAFGVLADFVIDKVVPAVEQYLVPAIDKLGQFLLSLTPTLERFGNLFAQNIGPAVARVGQFFVEEMLPALQRFGVFLQDTVIPALADLAKWAQQYVLPVVMELGRLFGQFVLPALQKVVSFIVTYVIPILKAVLGPVLETVNGFLANLRDRLGENSGKFGELMQRLKPIAEFMRDVLAPVVGVILARAFEVVGTVVVGTISVFVRLLDIITRVIEKVIEFTRRVADSKIGSALGAIIAKIPGRAFGGPVGVGKPYIVGERGPELFVPTGSGRIEPSAGGGGINITVNGAIDAEGTARTIIRVLEDAQRRSGVRLAL